MLGAFAVQVFLNPLAWILPCLTLILPILLMYKAHQPTTHLIDCSKNHITFWKLADLKLLRGSFFSSYFLHNLAILYAVNFPHVSI